MPYATTAQLKAYLNITGTAQDTLLSDILDRASSFIDTFTGRNFNPAITVTDEIYDVSSGVFFLRQMDILSVTKLEVGYGTNWTEIDASNYVWNRQGRIIIHGGADRSAIIAVKPSYGLANYRVSYTYGRTEVPKDIVQACLDVAATIYTSRSGGNKQSETIGQYSVTYAQEGKNIEKSNPDVLGILSRYKRVRV